MYCNQLNYSLCWTQFQTKRGIYKLRFKTRNIIGQIEYFIILYCTLLLRICSYHHFTDRSLQTWRRKNTLSNYANWQCYFMHQNLKSLVKVLVDMIYASSKSNIKIYVYVIYNMQPWKSAPQVYIYFHVIDTFQYSK